MATRTATNTKKKTYEVVCDIQVQLDRDTGTVTVRLDPDCNYNNIPDVRFVFSECQLRGMLNLLVPPNENNWQELSEIEVYE